MPVVPVVTGDGEGDQARLVFYIGVNERRIWGHGVNPHVNDPFSQEILNLACFARGCARKSDWNLGGVVVIVGNKRGWHFYANRFQSGNPEKLMQSS